MAAGLTGVGPRVALTLVATVALTVVVSAVGGSAGPWGTSTTTSTSTTSSTTTSTTQESPPAIDVNTLVRCFSGPSAQVSATAFVDGSVVRIDALRIRDVPKGCSNPRSFCVKLPSGFSGTLQGLLRVSSSGHLQVVPQARVTQDQAGSSTLDVQSGNLVACPQRAVPESKTTQAPIQPPTRRGSDAASSTSTPPGTVVGQGKPTPTDGDVHP